MHRRSLLLLLATGSLATVPLAACGPQSTGGSPVPSASSAPRAAVAADYGWFATNTDLSKGFSFIWVKSLTTHQILERLGGQELERVFWNQMVGSGDGQRGGSDRYFFGVGRVADDWVLVVEDNDNLGAAKDLLLPLSRGTTVISHYRASTAAPGRLLVLTDRSVDLDFDPLGRAAPTGARANDLASTLSAVGFGESADPAERTAAAFALTERLTGIAMTQKLLQTKTYLLSSRARPATQ